MPTPPPHGIFVPVPTFFARQRSSNYNATTPPLDTATQVEHALVLANNGVNGIVLLGSTGEAVHVTRQERKQLIAAVKDGLSKNGFPDYPLIAGTATNSVDETVELLHDSKEAGTQWGLVLVPGYFASAVSQDGIVQWFQAVADQSPIPILIYHYPGVSNNVKITLQTMRTLAAHKNIVGAKFSHGDVSIHGQVALDPTINHDEFCLFTGLGQHLFSVVQLGCAGAIDALAGVFPASVVKLYGLAAADNMDRVQRETARKLQYAISRAEELVVLWGTVGIKEALARIYDMGDRDGARLPLKGGFPNGDDEWKNWAAFMAEMLAMEEAEGTRKIIHK